MLGNPPYRMIDKEFLNKTDHQNFNIYVKEKVGNEEKFVLFADRSEKHQDKIKMLLNTGFLDQNIYIHVGERIAYFKQLAEHLKNLSDKNKISHMVSTQKLFLAAKELVDDIDIEGVSKVIVEIGDVVVGVMRSLFAQTDINFKTMDKFVANDFTSYTHSVNVAFYSLAYGIHVKLNDDDLHLLGIGALFHDIGLFPVPQDVIQKEGLFHDFGVLPNGPENKEWEQEDEPNHLFNHPGRGREMLAELRQYPNTVLDIVEQHHESWDGSGYPNKLEGKQISCLARICKIADSFDTLRNPRTYRPHNYSAFQALNIMVKDLKGQFEPEILKKFIKIVGHEKSKPTW